MIRSAPLLPRCGSRIDGYVGADGYLYEHTIPPGGGLCPEVQGILPGREPFWTRVGVLNRRGYLFRTLGS